MFAELPETLKRTVHQYLMAGDFIKAKNIHDNWKAKQEAAQQHPLDWKICSDSNCPITL